MFLYGSYFKRYFNMYIYVDLFGDKYFDVLDFDIRYCVLVFMDDRFDFYLV